MTLQSDDLHQYIVHPHQSAVELQNLSHGLTSSGVRAMQSLVCRATGCDVQSLAALIRPDQGGEMLDPRGKALCGEQLNGLEIAAMGITFNGEAQVRGQASRYTTSMPPCISTSGLGGSFTAVVFIHEDFPP